MLVVGEPGPAEASESCIIEASAGIVLRRAREASGYTLQDVAAATRIAQRFLAAIEASEFTSFRAPLYAIGFAKTFARHVGVSECWVADAVRERIAGDSPRPLVNDPPRRGSPARPSRIRERR
jgi:cytoskeletal protein RodZ